MQEEQAEQTDEATEPSAEATEGAADDSAAEGAPTDEGQAAPPDPPTGGGTDEEVLKAPEVPDDANEKISAAQEHINSLNMDEERDAAERAQKQL